MLHLRNSLQNCDQVGGFESILALTDWARRWLVEDIRSEILSFAKVSKKRALMSGPYTSGALR
jgi:hypothetical protein